MKLNYIYLFQAWESNASVLCIVGEDDHCINPQLTYRFLNLVPKEHKHRFHVIKYPGAGHLIEPPFAPHCIASFHKHLGKKKNMFKLVISWLYQKNYFGTSLRRIWKYYIPIHLWVKRFYFTLTWQKKQPVWIPSQSSLIYFRMYFWLGWRN